MSNFSRFAVYYLPPAGELADFGAAWLGWDIVRGVSVTHIEMPGFDVGAMTASASPYGFHGTLKAPFRLRPARGEEELLSAVADLADTQGPVQMFGLKLSRLGRFLALTALGDSTALDTLAASCVIELDQFRAPLTEADVVRREKNSPLSERQGDLLRRWGYPYVMDEFRFHMTLTGPLDDPEAVASQLEPRIAPYLPRPFDITEITLVGEQADGHFVEIARYALRG